MVYVFILVVFVSVNGVKVSRDEFNIIGYKFDILCFNLGIDDYCIKVLVLVVIVFIVFLFMVIIVGVFVCCFFKLL